MSELLFLNFEGNDIPVREDGYWNLTAMCKKHGKNLADFLRLKSTQEYFREFKSGVSVKYLKNGPAVYLQDLLKAGYKIRPIRLVDRLRKQIDKGIYPG